MNNRAAVSLEGEGLLELGEFRASPSAPTAVAMAPLKWTEVGQLGSADRPASQDWSRRARRDPSDYSTDDGVAPVEPLGERHSDQHCASPPGTSRHVSGSSCSGRIPSGTDTLGVELSLSISGLERPKPRQSPDLGERRDVRPLKEWGSRARSPGLIGSRSEGAARCTRG